MVSSIVKQVAGKKIWISLHRLLEIVKPEIQQDIINAIVNPDISRHQHIPCMAKRKKKNLNDTASSSSSSSSSGLGPTNDNENFTVDMVGEAIALQ